MKTYFVLFLIITVAINSSCTTEKIVLRNNRLALIKQYPSLPSGTDSLFFVQPEGTFKAKIDDKGEFLVITADTSQGMRVLGRKELSKLPAAEKISLINRTHEKPLALKYYFPESDTTYSRTRAGKTDTVLLGEKFKYLDFEPVLQTLAIPFKIRPGLRDDELGEIPPQAESGFTVALAGGWKINRNVYRAKKNIFDERVTTVSFTPGIFLGSGIAELSDKNTSAPVIPVARKAVTISTGGFLMFGASRFNFGYAFGFDHATGPGRKQWIYRGELWHGLVLGLDLIK